MRLGTYTINCEFTTEAHLPAFKGSTLRGAMGHALKKVSCALPRQTCQGCLLAGTCTYSVMFETHKYVPDNDEEKARMAHRSHPYVIVPPLDGKRHFEKGETFSFGLLLFGRAVNALPYMLYSIEQMGEAGIGNRRNGASGLFEMKSVTQSGHEIFSSETRVLSRSEDLVDTIRLEGRPGEDTENIVVNFVTPFRVKFDNRYTDQVPFHLLVRTALRRISDLEILYGEGEPDLDYRGLVSKAENIASETSSTRWFDIERYSSRQQTAMKFGGVMGTASYRGDVGKFLPLLRYCERTHLGKQTAFGLGMISVREH